MNKKLSTLLYVISLPFLFTLSLQAQDTVKVMCYNLENYTPADTSRNAYFRTILSEIKPDILVVEEITSQAAVDIFLNNVLKSFNSNYSTGTFIANTYSSLDSTNNAIFLKNDKFNFIINTAIHTPGIRDINAFKLEHKVTNQEVIVFGLHLKASQGVDNEIKRANGAASLRNFTDALSPGSYFMVVGDFNIYGSAESAYQLLLITSGSNEGYFIDPININGAWNNEIYAQYHTQSTRSSSGGLDDRFDMILYSHAISQPGGVYYVSNTIIPYGNDGQHYNKSINDLPTNTAVSANIADALYNASDHLPVYASFEFSSATAVEEIINLPLAFSLSQNYPNPFNPGTVIKYSLSEAGHVELKIYNVLGQQIKTLVNEFKSAGNYQITFNAAGLNSGVYFYQIRTDNKILSKKMILLK